MEKNSRDKRRKKTKNPQAVRNQRVIIFTFVIILALMFQSNHWKLEKEKLIKEAGGMEVLESLESRKNEKKPAVEEEPPMDLPVDEDMAVAAVAGPSGKSARVSGDEAEAGAENGPEAETGTGTEAGTETGPETGTGTETGPETGTGTEAGPETGTGTETGPDTGTDTEAGLETGTSAETGPETGLETGVGAGAGAGAGTETTPDGDGLVIREEDLWCLMLTNARYPVPDDYEVELTEVPGSNQSVDSRIYEPLMSMFEAMKSEGMSPRLCSGYRTLDKQEKLFNRKVQSYVRSGYSMEKANEMARQVLSIPGSGEHCLGLAVDIYSASYKRLETGFEKTPEGMWLREHSQDYGFILRYEKGKEEITGIQYEPWHFRYVGVEAARYLKEHQLSLEEFYIEQSLYG